MLKRSHYIALALVVLMTLMVLNLPRKTAAHLKAGLGSVFLPLFGLANSSQDLAERAGDAVLSRSDLLRQIAALRRERDELRLQATRAEAVARENERLRELVKWQAQPRRGKFKLARVVVRDPANWWRTVQIDLGSRNGLSNNLPVLAPDGALVGRIAAVGVTSSQVVLLGDPTCKVAARVDDATRDTGIIRSSGPLESELVELTFLSGSANLRPGQTVRTAGVDGGIFPKDILIGQIVDIRPVESGLETMARVKLATNLSGLDEVWVMMEP